MLGESIPAHLPHAISVSLPTWRDNVGYEEGEKRVIDSMCTGYPRFFIHKDIQRLAAKCEHKFAVEGEKCLLFPRAKIAEACRTYMLEHGSPPAIRLVQFLIHTPSSAVAQNSSRLERKELELHIVLFPQDAFPIAKSFWQHTGLGISSRMAEQLLAVIPDDKPTSQPPIRTFVGPKTKLGGRYAAKQRTFPLSPVLNTTSLSLRSSDNDVEETPSTELSLYLEERYGRNESIDSVDLVKRTLRRRIAGVLTHDRRVSEDQGSLDSSISEVGPSFRGVEVTEDDVYLFPGGMAAIWYAHQLALAARPVAKSICFGFPYTDTLKILQKWGPGCHFFGHGVDSDIDALEVLLASSESIAPPALALFCEFPSNPLLRSPNLPRLRALADRFDFLIVVDETLGNFANVEVLPHADIVVSSLTKVFSGGSNVMGGSLVLNPKGRHYTGLKSSLNGIYEDSYFAQDAIFMERNSRNFVKRSLAINSNTEAICDFLRSRSVAGSSSDGSNREAEPPTQFAIKDVFYPKWETRENYDSCRLKEAVFTGSGLPDESSATGGFGGLFSLTFTSVDASKAFFDNLHCEKGPSLGTNFTLACPYTILAHYNELDWAAQYGVEEGLVRVSVGLESLDVLMEWFTTALEKAEAAVKLDK